MEVLIQIHEDFIQKLTKLCMLDSKSRQLKEVVTKVLQIALYFRQLCNKYLLCSDIAGVDPCADLDEDLPADLLDEPDDLGLNTDSPGKKKRENSLDNYGRGLLKVSSVRFMDHA